MLQKNLDLIYKMCFFWLVLDDGKITTKKVKVVVKTSYVVGSYDK